MLAHCELPLIYHKLCYKEIRIPPKLRVLPCGTLLQTLDLENFVTASRWCDRQNSSTVAPVDYTYDGRARHGWMHNACYTSADCHPLTPFLRLIVDLLYNCSVVPALLCSSWQNFDWHIASRGPSATDLLVTSVLFLLSVKQLDSENTSISCPRWTRVTGCLICITLYTEVNAQCDKLVTVVGRTKLTILTRTNFRPMSLPSLSNWASHVCVQHDAH